MSELAIIPVGLRGAWYHFVNSRRTHELRIWAWEVVGTIHKHYSADRPLIDLVLGKCSARVIMLSEQGLSIVMLASPDARELFRRCLIEGGCYLEAMRLAQMTATPLSREEIVALGHHHLVSFTAEEVEQFLVLALQTRGMSELDLRRLSKQFDVEMEHIVL